MKNYKIKIALFSLGFTTLLGCAKLQDFGDTNDNPAAITNPSTTAHLTNVLRTIPNWATDNNAATWIQYVSESQYPGAGLYNESSTYFGFGTYTNELLNLKTVITKSSNPNEVAVARILTQYIYWHLTDGLGDIPYSQALQGTTPAYDKQENIYKGMIADLKAANAQFQGTTLNGDILNNGDIAKWKKFANSLRAMMAIQLTKKYPGTSEYAAVEFRAAISDGVMTSNSDNVQLIYPGAPSYQNPFWLAHDGARDDGESTQLYGMLTALSDGRQAAYGSSAIAVPHGISEADINLFIKNNINWSRTLADNQRTEKSPVYILRASQLYMARAEAAERGWTTENKTAMYELGINTSFAQWGLPLPPATYFTQSGVILNGTNNLKKIAEQAFLSAFPDGMAGWNIWRRTGYPVLIPAPAPLNPLHSTVPYRYTFTPATASTFSEYSLNPAGVASSIATLGANPTAGDFQENKVWWAK